MKTCDDQQINSKTNISMGREREKKKRNFLKIKKKKTLCLDRLKRNDSER